MKKTLLTASLAFALAAAAAQAHEGRPTVNGVITNIDQQAGTITLDHDAIPNLQMDAMTMAYSVNDRAMLKGLKAGDKVKFEAAEVNGAPSIVEIEKTK